MMTHSQYFRLPSVSIALILLLFASYGSFSSSSTSPTSSTTPTYYRLTNYQQQAPYGVSSGTYTYNARSQIDKSYSVISTNSKVIYRSTSSYNYDSNQQLIKLTLLSIGYYSTPTGVIKARNTETTTYSYNSVSGKRVSERRIIEGQYFPLQGNLPAPTTSFSTISYSYQNGFLNQRYYESGSYKSTNSYTVDSQGNFLSVTIKSTLSLSTITYSLDNSLRQIGSNYIRTTLAFPAQVATKTTTYTYDNSSGKLLREHHQSSNSDITISRTYENQPCKHPRRPTSSPNLDKAYCRER